MNTRLFALKSSAFRCIQSVGFPSILQRLSNDHNYTYFGTQYRPCTLDSSGSRPPLPGLPADFTTELPAKLYSGRTCTCWVTISNFIHLSVESQRLGLHWARGPVCYAIILILDGYSDYIIGLPMRSHLTFSSSLSHDQYKLITRASTLSFLTNPQYLLSWLLS